MKRLKKNKDYVIIRRTAYYMVGPSLYYHKRYVCEKCGFKLIRPVNIKCPQCKIEIIWV